MTERQRPRDLAAILRDGGPDRAPSELLVSVLARTARASQRPALLAAALGAPSLGANELRRSQVRIILLAALLAVLGLSAMAGSGFFTERDPQLVLRPAEPTARPSDRGTPSPSPSSGPLESPVTVHVGPQPSSARGPYVDQASGYWFTGTWTFVPSVAGFAQGGCVVDFCPVIVSVSTVVAGEPEDVLADDGRSARIQGRDLDEARASWATAFPDETIEDRTIDGHPGFIAWNLVQHSAHGIAFNGERMYLFNARSLFGAARLPLDRFIPYFHFFPRPCWLAPCEAGADAAVPTHAYAGVLLDSTLGSWAEITPGTLDPVIDASMRQFSGREGGSASSFGFGSGFIGGARVSIGTAVTGAPVSLDAGNGTTTPKRVRGASLDALRASWEDVFGHDSFTGISIDGVDAWQVTSGQAMSVVTIHRGMVIVVTTWGLTNFDLDARSALARFLPGFRLQQ